MCKWINKPCKRRKHNNEYMNVICNLLTMNLPEAPNALTAIFSHLNFNHYVIGSQTLINKAVDLLHFLNASTIYFVNADLQDKTS